MSASSSIFLSTVVKNGFWRNRLITFRTYIFSVTCMGPFQFVLLPTILLNTFFCIMANALKFEISEKWGKCLIGPFYNSVSSITRTFIFRSLIVYSLRVNSSWYSRICRSTSMASNLHFNLLSCVGEKPEPLQSDSFLAKIPALPVPRAVAELLFWNVWLSLCTSRFVKENDRRPNDFIMIETRNGL